MKIPSIVLAMLVAGLTATSSWAAAISVNFNGANGNNTNPTGPSVTGLAGVVRVANWNNAPNATGASLTLVNDLGVNAALLVSYSSSNVYGATPSGGGISGGAGDLSLMTGYLDNFTGAGGRSIVVSGLGPEFTLGGYYIIVYQNSDSNGSFGYSVTDTASHVDTRFGLQTSGNGANYPLVGGTDGYIGSTTSTSAGPASAANYVTLTGFTGSGFTLTGITGTTGDGRPRVNGFQIVAVPEPSGALLCAGMLTLAGAMRRRRSVAA